MQGLKRIFIGIKVKCGRDFIASLMGLQGAFVNEKMRWVPAENYHLTLRFLGNTSRAQIDSLKQEFEITAQKIKVLTFS